MPGRRNHPTIRSVHRALSAVPSTEPVIALAGVFQAAALVRDLAREGGVEREPFEASILSIFQIDAPSAEAVFGELGALTYGFRVLCRQLGTDNAIRDSELTRYGIGLLHLERKLVKRRDLLERIRSEVLTAADRAQYFSPTHENVIAKLADIYQATVSTLQPRIMVSGEREYLDNANNANRVRALLLGGIRAAVLWRQVGGSRWNLIFSRAQIVSAAESILREVPKGENQIRN